MKAIPTFYNGINFRSRAEANWAAAFDIMGIPYIYEIEAFEFEDGTQYLPDFYLPDSRSFFEVKGVMTELDEHKIRMLCKESGRPVDIGYADGFFCSCVNGWEEKDGIYFYPQFRRRFDAGSFEYDVGQSFINRCTECGKLSFMEYFGSYECRCCGAHDGDHFLDEVYSNANFRAALDAAIETVGQYKVKGANNGKSNRHH